MTTAFTDRVALVVGASSSIGLAVANRFAIEGTRVVLADVDPAVAEHAEAMRAHYRGAISVVSGDVSSAASVRQMVFGALRAHGRLDFAFNDIRMGEGDPILAALWSCMKYEMAALLGSGGAIVNNAAVMQTVAGRRRLMSATRTASMECGSLGIRVNAVCSSSDGVPGSSCSPEDVAEAVLWLCTEHSSFMGGIPAGYPPEGWIIEANGSAAQPLPH